MGLIERDKILREIGRDAESDGNQRAAQILECILNAHTVDAIPVVRCGECRQWERRKRLWVEVGTCKRNGADFEECDFCSYGEPRTPPAE